MTRFLYIYLFRGRNLNGNQIECERLFPFFSSSSTWLFIFLLCLSRLFLSKLPPPRSATMGPRPSSSSPHNHWSAEPAWMKSTFQFHRMYILSKTHIQRVSNYYHGWIVCSWTRCYWAPPHKNSFRSPLSNRNEICNSTNNPIGQSKSDWKSAFPISYQQ